MNKTKSEIILDSIIDGVRVTTFKVIFPRIVAEEILRHRAMSFCSSSARARSVKSTIEDSVDFTPTKWRFIDTINPGMVPIEKDISSLDNLELNEIWDAGMKEAKRIALLLTEKGVAKEIANRVLVPYQYITLIINTTEPGLRNFFKLRTASDAQYEIRELAILMQDEYSKSIPQERSIHLPFILEQSENIMNDILISVARCARISYLSKGKSEDQDIELAHRLLKSLHLSPFEFIVMNRSKTNRLVGNAFWREIAFMDGIRHSEDSLSDLSGNLHNKSLVQLRKLIERGWRF
jgi:thymidylate synthase ThyX